MAVEPARDGLALSDYYKPPSAPRFLAKWFDIGSLEWAEQNASNQGDNAAAQLFRDALNIRSPRRPGPFSRKATAS